MAGGAFAGKPASGGRSMSSGAASHPIVGKPVGLPSGHPRATTASQHFHHGRHVHHGKHVHHRGHFHHKHGFVATAVVAPVLYYPGPYWYPNYYYPGPYYYPPPPSYYPPPPAWYFCPAYNAYYPPHVACPY
jgi:hypothetical protein